MAESDRFRDKMAERYFKAPIADEATYRKNSPRRSSICNRTCGCWNLAVAVAAWHTRRNGVHGSAQTLIELWALLAVGGAFLQNLLQNLRSMPVSAPLPRTLEPTGW